MTAAMRVLNRAVDQPASPDLRARIADLCERLFRSIGLQTSVAKYHASGEERGAVLDFVDYPLNNRWWLEDEFKKIRAMTTDEEKRRRLHEIAGWENPGPGSFYDNPGNLSKSPHVIRADVRPSNPSSISEPGTTFWWWDQGKSRARLSWQVTMWPIAVVYEGLPEAALCGAVDRLRASPAADQRRTCDPVARRQGDRREEGVPGRREILEGRQARVDVGPSDG